MDKILVIDDDMDMCNLLSRFLNKKGYEVATAPSGKKGLELLQSFNPDIVLSDYRLDDMNGNDLLMQIKAYNFSLPVIIITGYSDIKTAVEVLKNGATDYVTKPLFPDEILLTIKKTLERSGNPARPAAPVQDNNKPVRTSVSSGSQALHHDDYISGESQVFINIMEQIRRVAPTNYSIILYGESGSGKEVIAKEIHHQSKRSSKPFMAIDCGALSKELAGSELFGHEKGSFTGAINQKIGIFELANTGTVFLDEIGNLSYDIQVSLLRVIQERKMRRIGGTKDIDLDVRIIVASNEKLLDAAKKGKFREDLYHRFNEFSINVPPLRERKADILLFAKHFLQQANIELQKTIQGFTPQVEQIFVNYVWHGNLRELKNVIKRSALLTDGQLIDVISLPFEITNFQKLQFDEAVIPAAPMTPIDYAQPANTYSGAAPMHPAQPQPIYTTPKKIELHENSLREASLDAEYETILEALKKVNFNKSKAAKLLNIDRKTLYNKMRQFHEFNND
ncbi:sigma-54-dependent transcriptional regulator [Pinibacter soli]|uniref:Sigma-54 dependent transcriptional regulator n=1 Tax=Pinibacter soli TaxID=3044211 RepID=A0ABT6RJ77_9BACT|nr:sigma-54 dependent transcriptional regulator [Pinibacter soli]MDI3322630.1 sigma-54 dependent transcriptional regulator [Pinibacter soli]